MSDSEAFEALTDCVACHVESAVVELIEPERSTDGTGRGHVLESRCRVCARSERGGAQIHAGERLFGDADAAIAALTRWSSEEGDDDPSRFVLAHFGGLDLAQVAEKLARGERVETSFDAIAWLFPGVGAIGGGGSAPASDARVTDVDASPRDTDVGGAPEPDASTSPEQARRSFPEAPMRSTSLAPAMIPQTHDSMPVHKNPIRVAARALASVMVADGVMTPSDRAFVERTLASWGHPPMREDDLAIWRPHDLGWPDDPARVVEAMARLAYVDGQRDATEWRVVREFARAWGVSLEALEVLGAKLEREHQRGLRRIVSTLTSLFVR